MLKVKMFRHQPIQILSKFNQFFNHQQNHTKNVTTWSHLATAFNSKPARKFNLTKDTVVSYLYYRNAFLFWPI